MRENEKAAVFNEAIDAMVAKAVEQKRPASPGAYAATVRADLRQRLQPVARDMFKRYGELTPEHLVTLLEAGEKPPEPATPTSALPTFTAQSAPAEPRMSRDEVRARIAEAKAALRTVSKPPIPPKEQIA